MNALLKLVALSLVLHASLARAQTCPGCVPLNDLGAGLYLGAHQGGMYPGGSNNPPALHSADAAWQAGLVTPRAPSGLPDTRNGLIGFISVGMSNTTQEFAVFERQEDHNTARNARVVIVDTAEGGMSADVISDPAHPYWTRVLDRVASVGLSPQQVQVAWLKQAQGAPTTTDFPDHALDLKSDLIAIVQQMRALFPNLRLCFVSSRIYGGYSTNPLRSEPLSYETGFAFKWLIEDQINADPALNYGRLPGPVNSPLLLWGPYLWANGSTPRADGLTWDATDYEPDFVHPSLAGEQKVADLLSGFFASDPTAILWNSPRADTALVALDATDDAFVRTQAPGANFGAVPTLSLANSQAQTDTPFLRFDGSSDLRPVLHAKLALRNQGGQPTPDLYRVEDTSWSEASITFASAPALTSFVRAVPHFSGGGTTAADVTLDVRSDPDRTLAYAFTAPPGQFRTFVSKEGGEAPWVVLMTRLPYCLGDANGDLTVDFDDISTVLSEWLEGPSAPLGDADADGFVDFSDITMVLVRWGSTCPPPAGPPAGQPALP
ncbi:MAG TPA: hypothetical protein DEB06_02650 [Phycisphaerales bacterium]|nr:hypothetical protein [Phycisphaerales bacterium]